MNLELLPDKQASTEATLLTSFFVSRVVFQDLYAGVLPGGVITARKKLTRMLNRTQDMFQREADKLAAKLAFSEASN